MLILYLNESPLSFNCLEDTTTNNQTKSPSSGRGALLVGAGILFSRLTGLVRERIFAHYFGNSDAADVFKAALRIPNFLQNLFGEGVLSASFIPVYARLQAEGKKDEARDIALAIGMILFFAVITLVIIGVFSTPILIDLIAPGFEGEKRRYAIELVRILFPGVGLLVMSAWCLGILNSHGKFFLSYSAPVVWNLAIVVMLLWAGKTYQHYDLALMTGWGVVLGSLLQTAVQIPTTFSLLTKISFKLAGARNGVQRVLANFGPVVLGRGVVQISAYIDSMLASLLPSGAVSALAYAQTIYLLPVSLFGMAISAAELPAMSGLVGLSEDSHQKLVHQLNQGLRRITFFVVPSAAAFLGLGDAIAAILFQTGKFTYDDSLYIWGILAGAAVGLLAATMGRLYASAFYALHDTRTPLRFAFIRVVLTIVLGYLFSLHLPPLLHIDLKWGVAGLTASAGIAGWVEFYLLQKSLTTRIGRSGIPLSHITKLWIIALISLLVTTSLRYLLGFPQGFWSSCISLFVFGITYVLLSMRLEISEARVLTKRFW